MQVIKRKKGDVYKVSVYMADKTRKTKTFKRKTDAKIWKRIQEEEIRRSDVCGTSTDGNVPFVEFVWNWYENEIVRRKAPSTQKNYYSDLKNHIAPCVGEIKLKDISVRHARELENSILKKGRSNRTVNKVMVLFKAILNDAVKSNNLLKNPIRGYPELPNKLKEVTYWSESEVLTFLSSNKKSNVYNLYLVALNTGMRLGELLGLCFDKLDFLNRQISVCRTFGRDGLRDTTKNHMIRIIPMNEIVYATLRRLFEKRGAGGYVFNKNGKPLDYNHITERCFVRDQKKAGLKKIIRFHDLRHTYASHFLMNGGNVYTLQKLLGHQDMKTTMIYSHLDSSYLKNASEQVVFCAEMKSKISRSKSTFLALKNQSG